MSWDPFQRAVLAELDVALYRVAGAPVAAHADAAAKPIPAAGDSGMLMVLARVLQLPVEALQPYPDVVAASAGLRGSAAAKRALWPRLRALRRALR
ncbi:MAG: hypothetical protein KUL77_03915 [Thermomonas sp.]|uniref:hypothetical protein n=1 Tax=Thermomonas sp. TaxID=1971895 RepID=UPI001EB92376|nr:hypothetical protein [Thermomonas sp.]MBV2208696.1 hypothetical protein [Thermomonas sp.]